jgi:hypothetical protein
MSGRHVRRHGERKWWSSKLHCCSVATSIHSRFCYCAPPSKDYCQATEDSLSESVLNTRRSDRQTDP